jgi:hypothetical protein
VTLKLSTRSLIMAVFVSACSALCSWDNLGSGKDVVNAYEDAVCPLNTPFNGLKGLGFHPQSQH